GVGGLPCRRHAFDYHHVGVPGSFAVAADYIFQHFIKFAIGQPPFHFRQLQRRRWCQAHGAADQRGGPFGAVVAWMGLGDGFEKVHAQAVALQRADQAQADRRQTDAESRWSEKKGMHHSASCVAEGVAARSSRARHSSVIWRSSSVGMTRMAGELPAWI